MNGSPQPTFKFSAQRRALLEKMLRKEGIDSSSGRIVRRKPSQLVPLSFAQQRLWFIDQLQKGSQFYNYPKAVHLTGPLNLTALEQSLSEIVRRHEVLRTSFVKRDGQPFQLILPPQPITLQHTDLTQLPAAERAPAAQRLLLEQAGQPFDLAQDRLVRASLLRFDAEQHRLLILMHHIVTDAWSMGVFVGEMAALYEAYNSGQASPLPELPIQYGDFAVWQREWSQGPELEAQSSYWREQFKDGVPVLELPTDRSRPAAQSYRGARETFTLSATVAEGLKALSGQQGVTLFMTLLAAWQTLLYRYTGQDDLVVGADMANRNRTELEELIGFFVNMLVMRGDLRGDPTFRELLGRTREVCLGAYAHQDMPFDKLVDELQPERELSRSPLFQVAFVLQNVPVPELELGELRISVVEVEPDSTAFDLVLSMDEAGDRLRGRVIYSTDLFERETMVRLVRHFERLLAGIVIDPGLQCSALPLLGEAERQQLLEEWNETETAYPRNACVHHLFEEQVRKTPEAVAVIYGADRLTYDELNRRANQLAQLLRKSGAGAESLVGICMERSAEMIVGLLAILKAGAAYVPLDTEYPLERLAYMLEDAQISVLVTQARWLENLPAHWAQVICVDTDQEEIARQSTKNLSRTVSANNLAYVIYTSGSTGSPKGICITHRAISRLVCESNYIQLNRDDHVAQASNASFDAATFEIWGALLHGACLEGVTRAVALSPALLASFLAERQISVLFLTTALFNQMAAHDAGVFRKIKHLLFGGEKVDPQWVRRVLEAEGRPRRLLHVYGPTESTTYASWTEVKDAPPTALTVPIGRPLSNTQLYVLDEQQQPVPVGVLGELCIGGDGLARGYLRAPELTAEKFIPHPHGLKAGALLYRTGDRVRYLPDGCIEFVGRVDKQVKVRGFRLELGEIETVLSEHDAIREVAVVAREDEAGEKRLVAYIVAAVDERAPTVSELRRYMLERLPEYMAPAVYVMLSKMPLTPNGKIDQAVLPAPEQSRPELMESFVAPRTRTEKALADVWREVLHVEQIGIHDNFFDLGGDSILSIRVVSRAQEHELSFSIQQLFQNPTVYELAQNLVDEQTTALGQTPPFSLISAQDRSQLPADVEDAYPLTRLQAGMVFHSEYSPETSVYHDIFSYELRAPLNLEMMRAAMRGISRRHAVLRTSFDLAGYSEPLQLVHRAVESAIEFTDLSGLSEVEQGKIIQGMIAAERGRGFEWERAPLLRMLFHQRSADVFQFTLSFHHVLLDGWSLATLLTELFHHYWHLIGKSSTDIGAPPPLHLREFVALERAAIESAECRQYWQKQVAESSVTILPRWPNAAPQTAARVLRDREVEITAATSGGLRSLARAAGVPLKNVLLAAHLRVLSFISGQSDVMTGLGWNGRPEQPGGEEIVGLFLNTLPFRQQLSGGTWHDLVRDVFSTEQGMLAYRRYPLVELQRQQGGELLFEVGFNFVHFHVLRGLSQLGGLEILKETSITETSVALLADCWVDPQTSQVKMKLAYDAGELCDEQVRAFAGYYERVLAAMAADPPARYEEISLLSDRERQQLLIEWNDTSRDYPPASSVQSLFQDQVQRSPDAIALVFGDQLLSYGELDRRANQLAHLLELRGVGPESLVGICMERSLDMVVALLGVLKAGGAYLPLDPTYPAARLSFMLADAAVSLLLTQQSLATVGAQPAVESLCVDTDWEQIAEHSEHQTALTVRADNLAYVIYTSGSTGRPKGVMISHSSLVNLALAQVAAFKVRPESRVLQFASFSFDASVSEFFTALLSGATLCMAPPQDLLPGPDLLSLLRRQQVSIVTLPPSVLAVLEEKQLPALRTVVAAGEACSAEVVARWASEQRQLINAYGPTEITVCASYALYRGRQAAGNGDGSHWSASGSRASGQAAPHIGRPLANTELYILDEHLQLAPVGVPGHLYVAGAGLARGYLRQPELTAAKFIPHPYSCVAGARLYATGDMGRYLSDGNIEYVGRVDEQVKIHGYRIETGEVETLLNEHESVRQAVVLAQADARGGKRLVAYVVGRAATAAELELWPSVAEYFIYDEALYHAMTHDERRNQSYQAAIGRAVRDKVVVDIGTGPEAILARFCVAAGARKVYAIELLAESYERARREVRRLGLEERIIVIHGDATKVELPESVDVCVSEIVGPIGGVEGAPVILNEARRYLKPEGVMIPRRSRTMMAAVTLPDEWLAETGFSATTREYVEKIFAQVGHAFDLRLCLKGLTEQQLLSEPGVFEELDFSGRVACEYERLERLRFTRSGRMDGLLVWLILETDAQAEPIDILAHEHCWLPVYMPVLDRGVSVEAGDELELEVRGRLSANGLNPDYELNGKLRRGSGEAIEIRYRSEHIAEGHSGRGLYGELFAEGKIKVRKSERKRAADQEKERELSEYLAKYLPGYMTPSALVMMDELPLTPNGKIDRRALPAPGQKRSAEYVAPGTEAEQTLARIWSEVLRVNQVGIHDNFFELGGDSILSIQVISRANKAGLLLSARQLFERSTVAALAAVAGSTMAVTAEQGLISGELPLTPVQHWFFEQRMADPHHFNQAVVLRARTSLDPALLERALKVIIAHHDALRVRFHQRPDGWQQINAEVEEHAVFEQVDLSSVTDQQLSATIEGAASAAQASLDLEQGPLMRLVYFDLGAARGARLLWVIHHLAVDGVSWRILLEDLRTAYEQLCGNEPARLPAKTTSFKQWAERMLEYARGEELRAEIPYWTSEYRKQVGRLPVDTVGTENSRESAAAVIVELDKEQTKALLQDVPQVYHTQINDLLLAALAWCLSGWSRQAQQLIDLEGHGREDLFEGVDVSRTVGWFTTIYPVLLEWGPQSGNSAEANALKQIKELLRRVPRRGIGYGLSRYLSPDGKLRECLRKMPAAEVSFNYIGQIDQLVDQDSPLAIADDPGGATQSSSGARRYLLEINANITGGQLRLSWRYSSNIHRKETIQALAADYLQRLRRLIRHCQTADAGGYTPSDFPKANLTQEQLDELLAEFQ